jgi:nitrate reductase alpha subunit
VNCTGSCSWKIYVKSGVVTWETQQTDYPRTRPGMPNHEPRGCSRGASYSWYLYSASRIKHPMVRGRLVKAWRDARKTLAPVEAWASIVGDAAGPMPPRYRKPRALPRRIQATGDLDRPGTRPASRPPKPPCA